MFPKALLASTVALCFALQVSAHAAVNPALGLKIDAVRKDVQRPKAGTECGKIDIASNLDTSKTIALGADDSFTATAQNFNLNRDGSLSFSAEVDPTGTGKSFVSATVTKNGDPAPATKGTTQISVQLPKGTKCSGGKNKDLCLVSFKSLSGFGNCVVVSQGAKAAPVASSATGKSTAVASSAAGKASSSGAVKSTVTSSAVKGTKTAKAGSMYKNGKKHKYHHKGKGMKKGDKKKDMKKDDMKKGDKKMEDNKKDSMKSKDDMKKDDMKKDDMKKDDMKDNMKDKDDAKSKNDMKVAPTSMQKGQDPAAQAKSAMMGKATRDAPLRAARNRLSE